MFLKYAVGEDSNTTDCKEIKPINPKGNQILNIHWKDWCWSWNSNTLATWCKELTHLKRPWFWERLKAGGEGVDRGWAGWMASPTKWTWIWVNSGNWWSTGRPGGLQSMGSQRVRHDWATERLDWTAWRNRHRDQNYGHGEGRRERVRCVERVTWKLMLPCVN